jgi:prolyl-tRNA editing enzyme YbaK/EbsC (Cys-tRNA(Pro) deacylase)
MEEAPMKVTLTEPDIAGSYVVAEQRDDGSLVLVPADSRADTKKRVRELAERHRETLDYLADH